MTNVKTASALILGSIISVIGVNFAYAQSSSFSPSPACTIENQDDCLLQRGQQVGKFARTLKSDTPFQDALKIACELNDAEACSSYSAILYDANNAISRAVSKYETIETNQSKALEVASKGCDLNSIASCAAVALMIDTKYQHSSNLDQKFSLQAYEATKKACALGLETSCNLVGHFAYPIEASDWHKGERAFYLEAKAYTEDACNNGSDTNCYDYAIFTVKAGQSDGGTQQELQLGLDMLSKRCEGGDQQSCQVYNQVK